MEARNLHLEEEQTYLIVSLEWISLHEEEHGRDVNNDNHTTHC